jgi:hypothetical protein
VRRGGYAQQVGKAREEPRAANDSPQLRGGSEQKRTDPFDSEDFPATITNSPKVAEIVYQRLVDSGFEIKSAESAETREEPRWERMTWSRTLKRCLCRNWQRWRQTWSAKSLLAR